MNEKICENVKRLSEERMGLLKLGGRWTEKD